MNDWVELLLMIGLSILLIAGCVLVAAAFFAAPGFVVLAVAGYEPIGFWVSAASGLGSIILGSILVSIINAFRG